MYIGMMMSWKLEAICTHKHTWELFYGIYLLQVTFCMCSFSSFKSKQSLLKSLPGDLPKLIKVRDKDDYKKAQ